MKVKELIELLQKEDPDSHIRINGDIPVHLEGKLGYWDGPYSYIDEDDNYILSTEGYKVDLVTLDVWDYVDWIYEDGMKWEDIKEKFKFKLGYVYKEDRESRSNRILEEAKNAFNDIVKVEEELKQLKNKKNQKL